MLGSAYNVVGWRAKMQLEGYNPKLAQTQPKENILK